MDNMDWLPDALFVVLWLGAMIATFVPIIPATLIIWSAALVHAVLTGFQPLGWLDLLGLGVVAIFATLVDNIAAAWGAKKFGGSSFAAWGALIGGLVGLFLGPLGFLIGPFAGAVLAELIIGKKAGYDAFRGGVGTLLGLLGGIGAKLLIHLGMGVVVMIQIFSR
jgi:uncharacterized protein